MTSNHHAPYDLGYTRTTMAGTTGSEAARWSQSYKSQSQFGLQAQLACMKSELLVIADQHAAVNTFPVLYTPPVTPREFTTPEVGGVTRKGASRRRWGR